MTEYFEPVPASDESFAKKSKHKINKKIKRTAQKQGVWLKSCDFVPDVVFCTGEPGCKTVAEKCVKVMGKSSDIVRIVDSIKDGSVLELVASAKNELNKCTQFLFVAGSGLSLDVKNTLKPGDAYIFEHSNNENILAIKNLKLRDVSHPGTLPKFFPYPNVNGIELRRRPAYYYSQSAVIPYRLEDEKLQLLIVSSGGRKHWGFPKGICEPGLTPQESAANEAKEEAGVLGDVENKIASRFQYQKWGANCDVAVYFMSVRCELPKSEWLESHRLKKWVSPTEAKQALKLKQFCAPIDLLEDQFKHEQYA